MASVSRGGQIRLTVQFYEFAGGPPYDPADPKLELFLGSTLIGGPFLYSSGAGPVVRESTGSYAYVWTVPSNATLGTYAAKWSGTIYGSTASGTEYFDVVVAGSVSTGSGSPNTIKDEYVLTFMSGATPMYVDPDEIKYLFPEATYVEITEFITYYSLEVDEIAPETIGTTAREYVKAATACALSKIYDYGGIGEETSIKLGDFSITNRAMPKQTVNRRNASTWCELAAALRLELTRNAVSLKAIVKGSNYSNPIPERQLRRLEK